MKPLREIRPKRELGLTASVSCAGVHFFPFASSTSFSTRTKFFGKFSALNLGNRPLESPLEKSAGDLYRPENMPRPNGLYAMTATPSSLQVCRRLICSDSISMENGE